MSPVSADPCHVAFVTPSLDMGGGARVAVHLASGLYSQGYRVDLVTLQPDGRSEMDAPTGVRIIRPTPSARVRPLSILLEGIMATGYVAAVTETLPSLVRYLRSERPAVMVSFAGSFAAIIARKLSGVQCRMVLTAHVVLTSILERQVWLRSQVQRYATQRVFDAADLIISVSHGVAKDVLRFGVPRDRVRVIYNPAIMPGFEERANESVQHPWFQDRTEPVVLGVGQFKRQKDFRTLIRAFARVRAARRAKLVILGEGAERQMLEDLIRQLRLTDCVDMPGYQDNPYKFMRASSVFALSSLYEGLPLVLTEALAAGTPVVATDCEAGPAEILAHGKFGRLVPVGDSVALANAILETLDEPPERKLLRARGMEFALENILPLYINALGLPPPHTAATGSFDK